jgi:hypothetical protein
MGKAAFDDFFRQSTIRRARTLNQGNGLRQDGSISMQDAIDKLID